ncbi:MAG: hypothetical protein PHC50_04515 [Candidatus Cloacimonetes bacterium]|nr:hypothetical protein [Candidatus Cloacimonadota bacterium]
MKCYEWEGKMIEVPDDIEIRLSIEPRNTSIATVPHSPLGESFANEATEQEKINFLAAVLTDMMEPF